MAKMTLTDPCCFISLRVSQQAGLAPAMSRIWKRTEPTYNPTDQGPSLF